MYRNPCSILISLTLAASALALADDCATVKSAMLNSGHTPHTVIVTKTDGQGKKIVTRQVQTVDNKYVQLPDGKWYAMNIAMKDLNDDTASIQECRRSGSDMVNGESAAVYEVRANLDGDVRDQKIWLSSKNLILKSEQIRKDGSYTTEYDFAHATPPANAIPMGGK